MDKITKLCNKIEIKAANNIDTLKELSELKLELETELEADNNVPDIDMIMEFCDVICLLCKETLIGTDFFRTIHNLAFQIDTELEKINPDNKNWPDTDLIIETLSDVELIEQIQKLFVNLKEDATKDVNELVKYRPLIFDYCSEYFMRTLLKNAQE